MAEKAADGTICSISQSSRYCRHRTFPNSRTYWTTSTYFVDLL